jgi:hypothetical protein
MVKRITMAFAVSVLQLVAFGVVFLVSWASEGGIQGNIADAVIFWLAFRLTAIIFTIGIVVVNLIDAIVNRILLKWILLVLQMALYLAYWLVVASLIDDSVEFFLYPALVAIVLKVPLEIVLRKKKPAKAITPQTV